MALSALGSGWRGRVERAVEGLGVAALPEATIGAVARLLDLVVAWNAKVDLTAARDADELVDLFLADALILAKLRPAISGLDWVDVGSGAGAPAIPLALLVPELELTLVEPKAKRVAFLRSALGASDGAMFESCGRDRRTSQAARATLPCHARRSTPRPGRARVHASRPKPCGSCSRGRRCRRSPAGASRVTCTTSGRSPALSVAPCVWSGCRERLRVGAFGGSWNRGVSAREYTRRALREINAVAACSARRGRHHRPESNRRRTVHRQLEPSS